MSEHSKIAGHLTREFSNNTLLQQLVGAHNANLARLEQRLGFLPGDMREKVDPYLRPLYDALHEMMPGEQVQKFLLSGEIEVAPLAFMRGRTLSNAFIILDEAQNSTTEQMKMFLTRLGFNSKTVITGDITQVDLPASRHSGLIGVQSILKGVPGVSFVYFDEHDVVRHRLVSAIIRAYGEAEARSAARAAGALPANAPDDEATAGPV